jgi:hypothetical protein
MAARGRRPLGREGARTGRWVLIRRRGHACFLPPAARGLRHREPVD